MATWDTNYEANPENADDISQGASEIRSTRAETRDRAETEHNWGTVTSGYDDDGRHVQGSGKVYVASTAPANLLKPDDTSQGVALGADDLGRVWVDTSGITPKVHYWDGTGWVGTVPAWNGFINGQFKVNQRTAFAAAETAATSKTYWFDRWYTIHTTAAGTVNRETTTLPTGAVSQVGIKVLGGAGCTAARVGQRLEAARARALGADQATNAFITISGKVRNTGASALTADLVINSANAADNFAAVTNVATSVGEISALAAGASVSFSYTLDIGTASAGAPSNGLDIYLLTTSPAAFVATENFVLTDMVVEIGSAVTKPAPEDFGEQLQLCRRYYQKTFPYATKPVTAGGFTGAINATTDNNSDVYYAWRHQPEMRATPTATTYNPSAANSSWRRIFAAADLAATTSPSSSATLISGLGGANVDYYAIQAAADAEL